MNLALWIISATLALLSLMKSREKTLKALRLTACKFIGILPLFLVVMAGFAVLVNLLPADVMHEYLGQESGFHGVLLSLSLGSVSVMPGFVAYPLAAALKIQDIPYYIIAGFVVALMNVGLVSFAFEKKYLGWKVALVRNLIGLVVSIVVIVIVKLIFHE